MTSLKKIFVAAALAVSTLVPATASQAIPLSAPNQAVDRQSDVTDVRVVCGYYGCRRGYRARYWRPRRVWVAPRVVIRPGRVVVRRGYNAHVNWCLGRYRSYNPATNLFVSYGGVYKVCRSPY